MTKKIKYSIDVSSAPEKLAEAVEHYVSQGGVIKVIAEGESREAEASRTAREADPEAELCAKVDLLKGLVAKGAGVAALQYSLRMNQRRSSDWRAKTASRYGVASLFGGLALIEREVWRP
jgi:hypothetical protein